MALPGIKIDFANGALGRAEASEDGVAGLLCSAELQDGTLILNKSFVIYSLEALEAMGATAETNPFLHKTVSDFYKEAGSTAELWVKAFPRSTTLTEMFGADKGGTLPECAKGRIRILAAAKQPEEDYVPDWEEAFDKDVWTACLAAQVFAEKATETLYSPLTVIMDGYAYNGATGNAQPKDIKSLGYDRVSVFVGNSDDSWGQAVGLPLGRLSANPVQRNLGRVKDGPVKLVEGFIGAVPVSLAQSEILHNAGYITLRTFAGRAGFFFNDDFITAGGDYSSITRRRTADKAYRIGYDTLLDELLDEMPVNEDGTLQAPRLKYLQNRVEQALANAMAGELSADVSAGDTGAECFIDPMQKVLLTSTLRVGMRVKPFAYARWINVDLGFKTPQEGGNE